VQNAAWDTATQRWHLDTAGGPLTADVMLVGNGPLAEPAVPDLPGLETFEGATFHSATWPDDHDLTGERVAVIGTGASAIQIVPEIQPVVGHMTLFQRTPAWVLPHTNRRISRAERALYRRFPALQRFVRGFVYWSRELFAGALIRNGKVLHRLEQLGAKQLDCIDDRELRARLTPDFRPGCKRLLLSNDYYPSLQQPNVDVVTEKIVGVTRNTVLTADGAEHPVDTIVFCTGFHVTDNPVADKLRGADGRTLAEHWEDSGAQAYLGATVPDFPNMFLLAGPNTGIGHTSLVVMIEAQLAYVTDALRLMDERGAASVNVRRPVFRAWSDEIQRKAKNTVWNSGGCASWYLDAEGRNTTIWPDYTFRFRRRTRRFDPASYELTAASSGGQH
jgi:cation diffusion facilitator CzcD-associated flavoprotein CzcO